jgi:hypothetical protein
MKVQAWTEVVTIPTYGIGQPEKNPMFLEKRVYQGSSGVVYPHPVIEKILDEKTDKEYNAVFIENDYLKIMLLPELGGRVQMAFDKSKQRHFVYYNQVIKPALVGLTGPWISGVLNLTGRSITALPLSNPPTIALKTMPMAALRFGAMNWNECSYPRHGRFYAASRQSLSRNKSKIVQPHQPARKPFCGGPTRQ